VIDYAHTPDALDKALSALRDTAAARGGRLVCVFGCGGNRDPGKRPLMGEVAARGADAVILTSDNPRDEDPQAILADIAAARRGRASIADRAEAIRAALAEADARDVVLIAGKGHETYQEIAGRRLPFSTSTARRRRWRHAEGRRTHDDEPDGMRKPWPPAARRWAATRASRACPPTRARSPAASCSSPSGASASTAMNSSRPPPPRRRRGDGRSRWAEGREPALPRWRWPTRAWRWAPWAPGGAPASRLPLVGVTGSNGKTTVKEMTAAILRAQRSADGYDPELAVLATAAT
jgi:hypothetical protein